AADAQGHVTDTIVAVIDDGVDYNHEDLTGNVFLNVDDPIGGGDNDNNGYVDDRRGWDFSAYAEGASPNPGDNDPLPEGSQTHGTQVAGIIAAKINNARGGAGIAGGPSASGDDSGRNSGVKILPIRVDDGTPTGFNALRFFKALQYAALRGAQIINVSLDTDAFAANGYQDPVVVMGLNTAYDGDNTHVPPIAGGALIVASDGNNNQANPARGVFNQVLFVANTDANDQRYAGVNGGQGASNYG